MCISKTGVIMSSSTNESNGCDILINSNKYTQNNPYIVEGSKDSGDMFVHTDMYQRIGGGQTYYLTCKSSLPISEGHNLSSNTYTIWFYLSKEYSPSNTGYDLPVCFHANNMVSYGVWKYTIPNGYNMVRIRLNPYNEINPIKPIIAYFWDIHMIPEKYYIPESPQLNNPSMHLSTNYLSANNLYEL